MMCDRKMPVELKDKVFKTIMAQYREKNWTTNILAGPAQRDGQDM